MDGLLIFPAPVAEAADYDEVLAALARLAGLDAVARARRDADGWVVTLEAAGRLQRARHADDGLVALEVVAPLFDRALADAGDPRRMYGFLAPEWGEEAGAVVCNPEALGAWRARGQVTAFAPPAPSVVTPVPSLDRATDSAGARVRLRETVD